MTVYYKKLVSEPKRAKPAQRYLELLLMFLFGCSLWSGYVYWAPVSHTDKLKSSVPVSPIDLRVARGLGTKGYNKMRISVITQGGPPQGPKDFSFTYQAPFKYRWTDNYLSSALVDLKAGRNDLKILGHDVVINLPPENSGVRGIFFSDPCFSSRWLPCKFGEQWNVFNKTVGLLNTVMAEEDMDYWMMLGDNFYDNKGDLTAALFADLSLETKSKIIGVVPGNHDYWLCGVPYCGWSSDQFAYGHMQYYPQDTWTTTGPRHNDSHFLSFDIDPSKNGWWPTKYMKSNNNASNMVWFNKIGNTGFIGYSGAHPWEEQEEAFEAACQYFSDSRAEFIFLLGHWDRLTYGCGKGMDVPSVYRRLRAMKGCKEFGHQIKYQDGHTHCNRVQEKEGDEAVGVLIGGFGMGAGVNEPGCGEFGFGFADTTRGALKYTYFPLQTTNGLDNYAALMACVKERGGLSKCAADFGRQWMNTSKRVSSPLIRF